MFSDFIFLVRKVHLKTYVHRRVVVAMISLIFFRSCISNVVLAPGCSMQRSSSHILQRRHYVASDMFRSCPHI
jgi:hypothetical protein